MVGRRGQGMLGWPLKSGEILFTDIGNQLRENCQVIELAKILTLKRE